MRALASVFRRSERSCRRTGRLLPLTVDRDRAAKEVDPIHSEAGGFGLSKAEPGADHDGRLERFGRCGEERVDLLDRHRVDGRCVDPR